MILEVLQWIANLKDQRPVTERVGNDVYAVEANRTLGKLVRPAAPLEKPTLELSTLTSFVDACNANIDNLMDEDCAVLVDSYRSVSLISVGADEFARRHVWIKAVADVPANFRFGQYYEPEEFVITAQAAFLPNDNLKALLALCSNLKTGSSVSVSNDGFSQTVVMQEGGVTHTGHAIPPRVGLAPYRTFREIEPVESDFLIRLRGREKALPEIALFEVDGGAWKGRTALAVKDWLVAKDGDFTVLA